MRLFGIFILLLFLSTLSQGYLGSFSAQGDELCETRDGSAKCEGGKVESLKPQTASDDEVKPAKAKKPKKNKKKFNEEMEKKRSIGAGDTDEERTIDNQWVRSIMPHPINAPLAPPLPRVHVKDLELPENIDYKNRVKPFVLTGAMEGWGALTKWPFDETGRDNSYLAKLFPRTVCDFYPYNMLENSSPYLIRFAPGLDEVMKPPGRFRDGAGKPWVCKEGCRYLHLQLTPEAWKKLEDAGDIDKKRHPQLEGDQWWMRRCLKDNAVREEFHLKTHWKIILIGSRGAGMFNHTDSLLTSSWHGHVQGRKWWYVCGRDYGPNNEMIGDPKCFEVTLYPGEVLYYGRSWWHHTRNVDTPTMTVTGTVVTPNNFEFIADKLHGECSRSAMSFDFSGALCDALDSCYNVWYKALKGKDAPTGRWVPWRQVATADEIATKDKRKPTDNNYDGRNYIAE